MLYMPLYCLKRMICTSIWHIIYTYYTSENNYGIIITEEAVSCLNQYVFAVDFEMGDPSIDEQALIVKRVLRWKWCQQIYVWYVCIWERWMNMHSFRCIMQCYSFTGGWPSAYEATLKKKSKCSTWNHKNWWLIRRPIIKPKLCTYVMQFTAGNYLTIS